MMNRRDLMKLGATSASSLALSRALPIAGLAASAAVAEAQSPGFTFVATTESKPWHDGVPSHTNFSWDTLNLNIENLDAATQSTQTIEGFGACFSELGWTSLSLLSETDREAVLAELFDPQGGARLNYCRMPIGANDYARKFYSYDEVKDDFDLSHFSIKQDEETLIPFIRSALKHQLKLRLWASPWTPPSWMKRNGFYAEAKPFPGMTDNGIKPEQVGREGQDMFILEPKYLQTYARYFGRFIDAYKARGIQIGMVMPQNEFNSAQSFPSCTWTPAGLAQFLEQLCPEMKMRGVDVFLGTLERGKPTLVEQVLADPRLNHQVTGLGLQWAAKNAVVQLHQKYPDLPLYQSEQECGDGANSWSYTSYCWKLMKEYFRNGVRAYMYWNIACLPGGKSAWGWA